LESDCPAKIEICKPDPLVHGNRAVISVTVARLLASARTVVAQFVLAVWMGIDKYNLSMINIVFVNA